MGERLALSRDYALRSQTRIDLLFTMSEIPHAHPVRDNACEVMFSRTTILMRQFVDLQFHLVEPDGIEPTTSCLQSTRSPS
jgi:hypothetical protein